MVSTRWLLVLKLRSCTFSPFRTSLASLSPHSIGTSLSASAYTSTLNVHSPSSCGRNVTEAVICRKMAWISAWISASVRSGAADVGSSGSAFSWSVALREAFFELGFLKISTCAARSDCQPAFLLLLLLFSPPRKFSLMVGDEREEGGVRTSNCHRSTCSPVSLLVMTTTSFEILPPIIHLLSCDMIFLMYALTWSSEDTSIVRPYFLTLRDVSTR